MESVTDARRRASAECRNTIEFGSTRYALPCGWCGAPSLFPPLKGGGTKCRGLRVGTSCLAVGTPVLGRPNPADFDGICDIAVVSPLGSACIGRLGRGVPTDSNEHSSVSKKAPPLPPFKGGLGAVHCRRCVRWAIRESPLRILSHIFRPPPHLSPF